MNLKLKESSTFIYFLVLAVIGFVSACNNSNITDLRSYNPGKTTVEPDNSSADAVKPGPEPVTDPVKPIQEVEVVFKTDVESLKLNQNSNLVVNMQETSGALSGGGTVVFALEKEREDVVVKLNDSVISVEGRTFTFSEIKNMKLEVSHKPAMEGTTMNFVAAGPLPPLKIVYKGESIKDQALELPLELSDVALLIAEDPQRNSGRMITPTTINVPNNVGLCIVNNFKDVLQLHGSPHQGDDGMGLGVCYDKFGGENKAVNEADLSTLVKCSNALPANRLSDTMYDHRNRQDEFEVFCKP